MIILLILQKLSNQKTVFIEFSVLIGLFFVLKHFMTVMSELIGIQKSFFFLIVTKHTLLIFLYTFFPQEKFQTVYSIEYLSTIGEVINLQGGHNH